MPAQSPTLSPTLSAMVAALRGSSSGMPASTLPTMSPPTSAPLVKMPPPRRAKIEISEAPKPSATSESTTSRLVFTRPITPVRTAIVASDAQQRRSQRPACRSPRQIETQDESPFARLSDAAWAGAYVGANGDQHPRESGQTRQKCSDQEPDCLGASRSRRR